MVKKMKTKIAAALLMAAISASASAEWSTGGPFQLNEYPTKEEGQRHTCSNYAIAIKDFDTRTRAGDHSQDELLKLYLEAYFKECRLPTHARDINEEHMK
jgi:hypothetical protein